MERKEYFTQEIENHKKLQVVAKNVVSDRDLWVKTYEEVALKAWGKSERKVLDFV